MLTFLHLSDTHFGTPYYGLGTTVGALLQEKRQQAFEKFVQMAIERKVDGVLHAGDLFDGDKTDYAQVEFLRVQLEKLGEFSIPFFFITGNHDPKGITFFKELPHVYQFPMREAKTVELDTFTVTGISQIPQDNRNPMDFVPVCRSKKPSLLLLHTHVMQAHKASHVYMPSSLDDLKTLGYDYLALGHVHRPMVLAKNPFTVYGGSFFPVNKKEEGQRGYYLVSVEKGFASSTFVPSSSVEFLSDSLHLSGKDYAHEIHKKVQSYHQETLLTLTLEGELPYEEREKYLGTLEYYRNHHNLLHLSIEDHLRFTSNEEFHPICNYLFEHSLEWDENWIRGKKLGFLEESPEDVLQRFHKNQERVLQEIGQAFRRDDEHQVD